MHLSVSRTNSGIVPVLVRKPLFWSNFVSEYYPTHFLKGLQYPHSDFVDHCQWLKLIVYLHVVFLNDFECWVKNCFHNHTFVFTLFSIIGMKRKKLSWTCTRFLFYLFIRDRSKSLPVDLYFDSDWHSTVNCSVILGCPSYKSGLPFWARHPQGLLPIRLTRLTSLLESFVLSAFFR